MKHILLIILSIFLSFTTLMAQDFWEVIEKPVNARIYSIEVKDTNMVFVGFGNDKGAYTYDAKHYIWKISGLESNSIYDLMVDDDGTVFAGTGGFVNLYRLFSIEEGWQPCYSFSSNIYCIENDLHNTIFCGGGYGGALYRSLNNGNSWEQVMTFGDGEIANAMLFVDDTTAFTGTLDFQGIAGGVYRSIDNGITWYHSGLQYEYISSLAINSAGVIFGGSRGNYSEGGGGVFKSEDYGNTWTELTDAIWVTSIVIDTNDVIYVGAEINSGQGGVFRSEDNGLTWERIISGMGQYPSVEGMCLSPDGYLYAYDSKLYRSIKPIYTSVDNNNIITKKALINLYPNPVNDLLFINTSAKIYEIFITDDTGRVVIQRVTNPTKSIDISQFTRGIYLVSINADGCRYSQKIVKL